MKVQIVKCTSGMWYKDKKLPLKTEVMEAKDYVIQNFNKIQTDSVDSYESFWRNNNVEDFYYSTQLMGYIAKNDCINDEDYLFTNSTLPNTNVTYLSEEQINKIEKVEFKKEDIKELNRGLRYNTDKLRYDLIHPQALKGLVQVLTRGSIKYAPRNWELGMPWTEVIASLKRHLSAIENGEDYDKETGLLHIDHLQCNSHFLSAYYKIAPQFDDRNHSYLNIKRIALDIDEVICDFTKGWSKLHGVDERPRSWNYHRAMLEEFDRMKKNRTLDDFYMSLEPKISPDDIPFEPCCYVTSRPIDTEITEKWLELYKFPTTKVITVKVGENKAQVLKENKVDIFVDDGWHNFIQLNKEGICTYLFDAPHNQRYDVGYKRIKSLKELI